MKLRPRFSLRTLLIAFLVICVVSGTVATWYRLAAAEHVRQLKVARRVEDLNGYVTWETERPWWARSAGKGSISDEFQRITGVGFSTQSPSHIIAVIRVLPEIPTLQHVCIDSHSLSRDVVAELAGVKTFKQLIINYGDVEYPAEVFLEQEQNRARDLKEIQRQLPKVDVIRGTDHST